MLVLIITILFLLPLIHVPISSSSRGIVRSVQENTQLSAVVSGKVIQNKLDNNNQLITKGDTLLVVTAAQLDTQKNLESNQSSDYVAQLQDLVKISRGQFSGLITGQYQREVSAMQEKIAQSTKNCLQKIRFIDQCGISRAFH